ncbi:MAG: nickel pincer cofactor biosynthesis protein LarC [Oscillospiraceae bacterium]
MKTLYLECNMGAAGDMLMASLLELLPAPGAFLAQMNALGLEGVTVTALPAEKCGIVGTHIAVKMQNGQEEESEDADPAGQVPHSHSPGGHQHTHEGHPHTHSHEEEHSHAQEPHGGHSHTGHPHSHPHRGMAEIRQLIGGLAVSPKVKQNIEAVYALIAEAEAKMHGRPVSEVHFHEVGALDAVADIAGVCLLLEQLAPEEIVVSPVHVGSGFVRCAHGLLPVPAPATALILQGVPTYSGSIRGELCTPTGAALLKHFATRFGPMPTMEVEKIGYGMGKKDFEAANCLRSFWGRAGASARQTGRVAELRCNLDDMTGEAVAFAGEQLLQSGALDVFTTPVQMKKGRPGLLLTCLCEEERAEEFAALLLRHTTTLGVRQTLCSRYTLAREIKEYKTPYGNVAVKVSSGYGVQKSKAEYEDLAAAAREHAVTLQQVQDALAKAAHGEKN